MAVIWGPFTVTLDTAHRMHIPVRLFGRILPETKREIAGQARDEGRAAERVLVKVTKKSID